MDPVLEALQAHDISLSEDDVNREVFRAFEASGGLPPFVRAALGLPSSQFAPAHFGATPFGTRFVDVVEQTLRHSEAAGLEWSGGEQLTADQMQLFRSGFGPAPIDPRAKATLELAAMLVTALTVEQAAAVFDAPVEEVQRWIDDGSLYGIEADGEYRLPIFQLDDQGHPIPQVREVFPFLSRAIHPVGVLHWFTEPNPDLASEETRYASLSPKTWLMQRLPPEPVRELAKHVA